jgi:hypothetical protein
MNDYKFEWTLTDLDDRILCKSNLNYILWFVHDLNIYNVDLIVTRKSDNKIFKKQKFSWINSVPVKNFNKK